MLMHPASQTEQTADYVERSPSPVTAVVALFMRVRCHRCLVLKRLIETVKIFTTTCREAAHFLSNIQGRPCPFHPEHKVDCVGTNLCGTGSLVLKQPSARYSRGSILLTAVQGTLCEARNLSANSGDLVIEAFHHGFRVAAA
jgi:hypothetical protein